MGHASLHTQSTCILWILRRHLTMSLQSILWEMVQEYEEPIARINSLYQWRGSLVHIADCQISLQ